MVIYQFCLLMWRCWKKHTAVVTNLLWGHFSFVILTWWTIPYGSMHIFCAWDHRKKHERCKQEVLAWLAWRKYNFLSFWVVYQANTKGQQNPYLLKLRQKRMHRQRKALPPCDDSKVTASCTARCTHECSQIVQHPQDGHAALCTHVIYWKNVANRRIYWTCPKVFCGSLQSCRARTLVTRINCEIRGRPAAERCTASCDRGLNNLMDLPD